ncbi:hypothetical protein CASFOL_012309 [Castilleja foliolosa]|uniref:Malectin-like domain-containing protein n=1 Tax=Castilleja foliolosa TaxID=1961234 RepID=A0ABD3DRW6_9LAMI
MPSPIPNRNSNSTTTRHTIRRPPSPSRSLLVAPPAGARCSYSRPELLIQPEVFWEFAAGDQFAVLCVHLGSICRWYPLDMYDRIWDADEDFSPYHVSSSFDSQSNFSLSNIKESPPIAVIQTARVLARWNNLIYNLPLDNNNNSNNQGGYHVVLYFAGILPVAPTFDVLINNQVVQSNYTVTRWEANTLSFNVNGIKTLNITLKRISYYPLVSALEVYEIIDIPLESSPTTVSALQFIQKSTGLDFGWVDDPCLPTPWEHVECDGNLVTSLKLFDVQLRTINPIFGDLLDLKELRILSSLCRLEIMVSSEDKDWADSCFAESSWDSLKDALLETLNTQNTPSPYMVDDSTEGPETGIFSEMDRDDVRNLSVELEQSKEDIFKIWDLEIPDEEDIGLIKQLNKALVESSLDPVLSVSDVDDDDSKAWKQLEKDESLDDLITGIADLSLSPNWE